MNSSYSGLGYKCKYWVLLEEFGVVDFVGNLGFLLHKNFEFKGFSFAIGVLHVRNMV